VLHRSVVVVRLEVTDVPYVAATDRLDVDALGFRDDGITLVTARFGYRDVPNLPRTLTDVARRGLEGRIDVLRASYFLSRITVVPTPSRNMHPWRKQLFVAMWRNQAEQIGYLGLPDDRTVTMGSVIEI
jgi:KUP system potassium uptake protein